MPTHTSCTGCGTAVSIAFARVFGDNTDETHACLHCTAITAIQSGAATAPDHDGTPRVHRPGTTDPQPITTEDQAEPQDDQPAVYLEDLREHGRDHATTTDEELTHVDDAFEALIAE